MNSNAPCSLEAADENEADEIARLLGDLESLDNGVGESQITGPLLNEADVEAIIAAIGSS